MTRAFKVFFYVVIFFSAAKAQSQWSQLSGVSGGRAASIAEVAGTNGRRIYAGTSNGVYLSKDTGQTWSSVGLSRYGIALIFPFVDSNGGEVLFAAASPSPNGQVARILFRSIDSGNTWNDISPNRNIVNAIVQHGNNCFISITGGGSDSANGVFRSSNLGNTWIRTDTNTSVVLVSLLVSNDTLIGLTGSAVWRAPVSGGPWIKGQKITVSNLIQEGSSLYAFAGRRTLCSIDNGLSWREIASAGSGKMGGVAMHGDTIVANYDNGSFISVDTGKYWSKLAGTHNFPRYVESSQNLGVTFAGSHFIVASPAGILRSKNCHDWEYGEGIPSAKVFDLAVYHDTLFAATPRGIFLSPDHGNTWSTPNTEEYLRDSIVLKLFMVDDELYASGPTGFWRWNNSRWDLRSANSIRALTSNGKWLFAGSTKLGFARSSDKGISWDTINWQLPHAWGAPVPSITCLLQFGSRLLLIVYDSDPNGGFGTRWPTVHGSTDNGDHWFYITGALGGNSTEDKLLTADSTVYLCSGTILRSLDSGDHWSAFKNYKTGNQSFGSFWASHDKLLVGTLGDGGDLISLSDTTATSLISTDSTSTILSFAVDDSYAYLGTDWRGIWRIPMADLKLGVHSALSTPRDAISVFPNPSNGYTSFVFDAPQGSRYRLDLYDELGAIRKKITGVCSSNHNTIKLAEPDGVYYATLAVDGRVLKTSVVIRH